ncbi:MAG: GNAT family N-acetyltransferase [Chitinophagales bacterium]
MKAENTEFKIVPYGSPDYDKTVVLRDLLLRKPLGLEFTKEELAKEDKHIHCAAYSNGEALACLVLVPLEKGRIKMRQVCTSKELQGKGVGRQLAIFSEQYAREKGFKTMECNARATAVPFYEKMNYKVVSDIFTEVGIDHYKMEKALR